LTLEAGAGAMVTRTEIKTVSGKINGQDVTVPAGTTILEAARLSGVEVPNLCFQPKLRPWGSCRICTVEILGKRGGLIESCATPLGEGMEVLTHSEPVIDARQFVLQMYLVDHALDCPTCDKSGECYLQENTYLHNVNTNPYRRPKLAASYVHFSDLIDYKWDRCIMCNRCTRVCDEVIGVTAIEATSRSMEASISPAFGEDLSLTDCTNCGMCIAVCPVGALTDRHFGHHPWELDTNETICGFCDVGCTINVESNKGIVRRTTNLWERGVNHGYVCEHGKWGHEIVQSPDRIYYPRVKEENGVVYEVTWEAAIDGVAETLAHYQGEAFAALASPDSTNEEVYAFQQFTRAVMNTNNIDRYQTPNQAAVGRSIEATLGKDVANTNNMQELLTDVKMQLVVGPDLGKSAPTASYWFYHSRLYREAKTVVISHDRYPLAWRGELWLNPAPGSTASLLNGIARQIIELGLGSSEVVRDSGFSSWQGRLLAFDLASVSAATGVTPENIRAAAILYATGGSGIGGGQDGAYPPALVYQTVAHQIGNEYGDAAEISAACNNLAILTGNFGRPGGGVASPRGGANSQGAYDMGATPTFLAGGGAVEDPAARSLFEAAWMPRWAEKAKTNNGFLPVRTLPSKAGKSQAQIVAAIERGEIKAMIVDGAVNGRQQTLDPALEAALTRLDFLVVFDSFDSPLSRLADVVLPKAMSLEKDGTFTSFDRTVQRVRAAVPPVGEAKSGIDFMAMLSQRLGYAMTYRAPSDVVSEIASLHPDYAGVTYARLERGGVSVPVESFASEGTPILMPGADGRVRLSPRLASTV